MQHPIIDIIQREVENYFDLTSGESHSKTRKREIVKSRQIIQFFCKEFNVGSLSFIGKNIGGKDHATVLHSCKAVNNMIDTDKKFREDVEEIKKRIDAELNILSSKEERLIILKKVFMLSLGVIIGNNDKQECQSHFDFSTTCGLLVLLGFSIKEISDYSGCNPEFVRKNAFSANRFKIKNMNTIFNRYYE